MLRSVSEWKHPRWWSCWLVVLAAGCDGGALAPPDGGPADFEVRVEHAPGRTLQPGDALEVERGCQGGTHTYVDVVARGEGLERAEVTAEVVGSGRPVRLRMDPTAEGAELRRLFLLVESFVLPGARDLPRDGEVRATVHRADGRWASLARPVRLVEGPSCAPFCEYETFSGVARITAVDGPRTDGCEPGEVRIEYRIVGEGGELAERGSTLLSAAPDCLEALGLVVGGEVPAGYQRIVSGTCSPFASWLDLDLDACAPRCP